jgi:TolB-like protein
MPDQSHSTGAVFLSYASQDAEAAGRICETLRAAGVEVWFDQSALRSGDAWDAQIRKQVHECALFLPVISASTDARTEGYFRREWNLATRRLLDMAHDMAFLVPVVIDETRDADARVPEEFLGVQWTRLPGGETPPAFAHRVRQLLGADSAATHTAHSGVTGKIERSAQKVISARPGSRWRVRPVGLTLIVLSLILGGGLFWRYQNATDMPATTPAPTTAEPVAAAAPNQKSIAVLPFADMSEKKDQEYMSDGIAEELLNLLSQVPELKVIARTSSFAFKGEKIEIAEIAKKLNVAHVVEGSVRKSGNKLRITVQLIRAADSTHLWSETYDRPLNDIFAVQDEIAGAIVQALQIRLAGGDLSRQKGGTQNLEAYQLYLRGISAQNQNTQSSRDTAGEYLEQAIKLDPNYGRAWLGLAANVNLKTDNGVLDPNVGYPRVRQLAQHAMQLSPALAAEVHSWLQYVHMVWDWDWDAAEAEGRRALAIDPTNPSVLTGAGMLARTLGRWDESERYLLAALVRDPLDPYTVWNLGNTYYRAGRFAESESTYRKLLELAPDFGWTRPYLGKTLLAQGKPEAALAMVQQVVDEGWRLLFLPVVLQEAGRQAEADEALKAQIVQWADTGAFYVAQTYAYRGDHDLALEWLERAYRQKDAYLVEITGDPMFKNLADDPRYKAFLRKMKLPEG